MIWLTLVNLKTTNMSQTERILSFVQVVDRGSFVGAARSLGISKAAISRQISQLEDELGVQLLERTTRKSWMTDAGELLYAQAKRVSDELDELWAVVSSYGEEPAGRLAVHCGRHFGERYLLPHLHEFCVCHPRITLLFELAERIPDWHIVFLTKEK